MIVTNTESGTNLYEIADGIYRISTPVPNFSFNQNVRHPSDCQLDDGGECRPSDAAQ